MNLTQYFEPIREDNERLRQVLRQKHNVDLSVCDTAELVHEMYLRGLSEEEAIYKIRQYYYEIGETIAGRYEN